LNAATHPIRATLVERYLRLRSIETFSGFDAVRWHPRCYYRKSEEDVPDTRAAWPAMIAAVTDLDGHVTGVHRTWLDPITGDKAPVAFPRRAMGRLLGHGVRFGKAGAAMVAGEGIETIASLRQIMPSLPMIAGLSAAHLAAILFPACLRRLYVARDPDAAGDAAFTTLFNRAAAAGIEVLPLHPTIGDFNDDLRAMGRDAMREALSFQLTESERSRFLIPGR
jgi:hypothetical protein